MTFWVLATDPNPQVRDGAHAVQLAERACALASPPAAANFDTLAAACAETGRFDESVRAMTKAVALATAAGQTGSLAKFQSRLELYRQGRPYHQPP